MKNTCTYKTVESGRGLCSEVVLKGRNRNDKVIAKNRTGED
jgi:hypothetical protein